MAYQVIGECAHVYGDSVPYHLLYKGAVLPDGVSDDCVRHLLSVGLIAGGDVKLPAAATVAPDASAVSAAKPTGDTQPDSKPAEVDAKRAEAQGKLPKDGSMPDKRAGQAVWVEYLVAQGSSYEDVRNADKADLISLAEQRTK